VSYLVDSDWLIDAFVGVPTAVQLLAGLRGDGLAVSIISYGELYEGALGAPDPTTELARFRTFLARLTLVPLDDAVMEIFARTRGELRRDGRLIPDLDLLIAATAIHHDLTLVTRNVRHFGRIHALQIHHPR
jgi:predicted nucleic acid-binding protein